MSELKPCPFCGKAPEKFGRGLRGKEIIEQVMHPHLENGCPLSILVFPKDSWNSRPIEDALRVKLEKAVEALKRIARSPYMTAVVSRVADDAIASIEGGEG